LSAVIIARREKSCITYVRTQAMRACAAVRARRIFAGASRMNKSPVTCEFGGNGHFFARSELFRRTRKKYADRCSFMKRSALENENGQQNIWTENFPADLFLP
jgi:hypothetical protein